MQPMREVLVRNLGRIKFSDAVKVQQQEVRKHKDFLAQKSKTESTEKPMNTLLICEHTPVYTIGIRTKGYTEKDEESLKTLGADFQRTDRGGLITFHGPGQLVAYPILNLADFKKSVRWYVCQLEKCVIRTCNAYGIEAQTMPDTGVWVHKKKIAAIGIHCSRYITSHGLALNCNTDLTWFDHIVPCGIKDKGVTSLTNELDREININDALGKFIEAFEAQFDCKVKKKDDCIEG
ncbi:octanoyl-[acyl-carrier-protein]:protein N-octanoyltransferase LIPT2, mitochondrial-like [Ptychodera flava]|uniref:octanoyl-[acyl-carrier-protein]:protein N-octanoyltransferase LIPT2, mitochondrial-like n=1 Tax=Ptychodera flava TaxID=63121 RepID=UPI003969D12C